MVEEDKVETNLQLFDLLPNELEVIILSFALFGSETGTGTGEGKKEGKEEGEDKEKNKNKEKDETNEKDDTKYK